ncbi:MAG: hypothetical protein FWF42_03845 [Streptococcaceae bacterium]|nr:hypothetical protein [Streptococcaceae bacterium]
MGLFNLFRNDQQDQKLCKLRDLIALAYADGEFTKDKRFIVFSILKEEGIDIEELPKVYGNAASIRDAYPTKEEDRARYMVQMVSLMTADGECSEKEIKFCEVIAKKLGFSAEYVSKVVAKFSADMMKVNENRAMQIVMSYIANGGEMK